MGKIGRPAGNCGKVTRQPGVWPIATFRRLLYHLVVEVGTWRTVKHRFLGGFSYHCYRNMSAVEVSLGISISWGICRGVYLNVRRNCQAKMIAVLLGAVCRDYCIRSVSEDSSTRSPTSYESDSGPSIDERLFTGRALCDSQGLQMCLRPEA
jgi:hypothetical protein